MVDFETWRRTVNGILRTSTLDHVYTVSLLYVTLLVVLTRRNCLTLNLNFKFVWQNFEP